MIRFSARVGLALLVVALLAAACGDDDDTATATDGSATASPEPTDGDAANGTTGDPEDEPGSPEGPEGPEGPCDQTVPGTQIDYAVFAPAQALDPPAASGSLVGGTELAAIYDVLMRFDPETGEYEPRLAAGMSSNDDHTVWTLQLRPDIAFDDGTPLDADLVLASLARYSPEDGSAVVSTAPAYLQFIAESRKVDELTLEFELTLSWANFPFVFADSPGMIVNVNAIGDDPEAFGAQPPPEAGIGPYILESNKPGEERVMRARADYWAGPVCIETLRFELATSSSAVGSRQVLDALRNGDIDVGFVREAAVIQDARAAGINESMAHQDAGVMLFLNLSEGEPLTDPELREAVALAIDVELINERAYDGALTVGKSLFVEGSPFFANDVSEIGTDPERAAEIAAEAAPDAPLRVLCDASPVNVEVALAVEAMLTAIGLEVEVENLPSTEFISRRGNGDFDIACGGYNMGPATAAFALLRNLVSTSPVNRSGLQDLELDELVLAAFSAPAAELPEAMRAVNEHFVDNHYGIPVGNLLEGIVYADHIVGIEQTASTIFLFGDAYID